MSWCHKTCSIVGLSHLVSSIPPPNILQKKHDKYPHIKKKKTNKLIIRINLFLFQRSYSWKVSCIFHWTRKKILCKKDKMAIVNLGTAVQSKIVCPTPQINSTANNFQLLKLIIWFRTSLQKNWLRSMKYFVDTQWLPLPIFCDLTVNGNCTKTIAVALYHCT